MRSDIPVTFYFRNLPHWRQVGATYFVTFRLFDSLPQSKLIELKSMRDDWLRHHPPPYEKASLDLLTRNLIIRVEKWLDAGYGSCVLARPEAKRVVEDSLHFFDGEKYLLGSYVIMPNHVHVILKPLVEHISLERILQGLKRHTSQTILRAMKLNGSFWQKESFDRIIRDELHLYKAVQYIGKNPSRAGLDSGHCLRWLRPEWEACGLHFDQGTF
ncbi:MAG: transposase [Planctomycetota bacterium]